MATGQTLKLVMLSAALVGTLAACTMSAGNADAPPGVRLDGAWKLDHAASDDPQTQIDKLREAVAKMAARRRVAYTPPPPGPGGRGMRQRQADPDEQDGPDPTSLRSAPADYLSHSPTMHELMDFITHGDYLTVHQEADRFALQYGSSARSFTPGGHSVVSADTGVADQVSGWKGKAYVIQIKPQVGPALTEEYSLSDDQKKLIVKLQVASSDLPAVELKQVYARATDSAPRAVPTNE